MTVTTNPRMMEVKHPDETTDYDFLWDAKLAEVGDTLSSATVVCDDLSITLGATAMTTTRVKQWLSGGTAGVTYKLVCRVVTSGGRHWTRAMYVSVKVP